MASILESVTQAGKNSKGILPGLLSSAKTSPLGVQAKAPVVTVPANTIPTNQVKAPIIKSTTTKTDPVKTYSNTNSTQSTIPTIKNTEQNDARDKNGLLVNPIGAKFDRNTGKPIETTINVDEKVSTKEEPYSVNKGLYGELVTGIANSPKSENNKKTTEVTNTLMGGDYSGRLKAAEDAQARAVSINEDLNRKINNQFSDDVGIKYQQGRAAALQRDYGIQAQAATTAAQNAAQLAGLTQSGLTSAGGLLNSQQGLQQSALGQAAGLASPQFQGYGSGEYRDPITGKTLEGQGGQYGTGPEAAANAQAHRDFQTKYLEGQANLRGADTIQGQIESTLLGNPELNQTDSLSFINSLNELISGQVGSAPQQLLAQQISNYIQQLGIDPATAVSIATQSRGTLAQLIDSLRDIAEAKVESYNPSNLSTGNYSGTGTSSGGGMFGSFFGN